MTEAARAPTLVRGLGLAAAMSVNIANMIGVGVFLKARVMTCNVGTPWSVLGVWIGGGLLALAGSACYAELGAMLPAAGGEYVFLRKAYGRPVGFLYGWTSFFVVKGGSQAALALGVALFLNIAIGGRLAEFHSDFSMFGAAMSIDLLTCIAVATIWTVALVNCASVSSSGLVSVALTLIKISLLLGVVCAAFFVAGGSWGHFNANAAGAACAGVPATAQGTAAGWGAALLGALWAYDGWNNVVPLAGEVRQPERNLPRALLFGLGLVLLLYLIINLSYFFVLTPLTIASLPASASVATEILHRAVGPLAVGLMAAGLMVSSFGSAHASLLGGSRIPYAMAREGVFFRALAAVSPRTHVPVRAILAQAVWATVLVLTGSFDTLTDAVIFSGFLFHALVTGALFIFRRTMPDAPRPYRVWGYPIVPAVFIVLSLGLVVNTFIATPKQAAFGSIMILLGLPFYAYWARRTSPSPS